jgi:acetaldehyde dehydrogenase/alcohol dehydrogenase
MKKEKEVTKRIPTVDELVANGLKALNEFLKMDQEQIDKIVHAMTLAGLDNYLTLAKLAVEETKRGNVEDKAIKNMFATEYIYHSIKDQKSVGIIDENDMEGYVEVAEPVGVVAGVTPVTNPTSTTLFKALICIKTRNPIIFAFHPSAQQCSADHQMMYRDFRRTATCPSLRQLRYRLRVQ